MPQRVELCERIGSKKIVQNQKLQGAMRGVATRILLGGKSTSGALRWKCGGRDLMAAIDPVSEPELDEAFEQGSEFGIRYLDSECRERILRYIKRCGRGYFNYHDLLDVYQETLIGMHAKAQEADF